MPFYSFFLSVTSSTYTIYGALSLFHCTKTHTHTIDVAAPCAPALLASRRCRASFIKFEIQFQFNAFLVRPLLLLLPCRVYGAESFVWGGLCALHSNVHCGFIQPWLWRMVILRTCFFFREKEIGVPP
uniref:(northern house mosquito) hypothetical protein n=1 Tax=Culex pipiens TaxID=7175 RepID=A0A8D8CHJ0_CULPI